MFRLREGLKTVMWEKAGIIRSGKGLKEALHEIDHMGGIITDYGYTREELELVNMTIVARLIVKSALMRRESIGAHYRIDAPASSKKSGHMRLNIHGLL